MAHPNCVLLRQLVEKHRRGDGLKIGTAVLRGVGPDDQSSESVGQNLMAVTNTEHWHAEVEDSVVNLVGVGGEDRSGTSRQDDAHRLHRTNLVGGDLTRHDLGIDVRLTNPPGYQLGVLSAEVDHEHAIEVTGRRLPRRRVHQPIPTPWERWSRLPSV